MLAEVEYPGQGYSEPFAGVLPLGPAGEGAEQGLLLKGTISTI